MQKAGGLTAGDISDCLYQIYGRDRTFAVPILTMCAMAGVLGAGGWDYVKPLPFELAMMPRQLFRWLHLTGVSYALPALIAIGQVRFFVKRPANPLSWLIRKLTRKPALNLLEKLQPSNGGFLEATPLTSFVTMSLAAMDITKHPVVEKGVQFIALSVRSDGSWPIDTNLSTWVTSLAVQALDTNDLSADDKQRTTDWYLAQQYSNDHVYTAAKPGGWGWTNLPGAVPDADDTAGALIALHRLGVESEAVKESARRGVQWLLELQNGDGGVPTFCKGWGKLEFDRSCPDITVHAIAAWQTWNDKCEPLFQQQITNATARALDYLETVQNDDGSWLPLWFGNPQSYSKTNPVYGTAKVLSALAELDKQPMSEQGAKFLLQAQNTDGGWGSEKGRVSTIEETALAVDALLAVDPRLYAESIQRGTDYLIEKTDCGTSFEPVPIGLYFAKLWYAERLYPMIFSLKALQSASAFFDLTDTESQG
jgi:squalene-hopene/tetraprenyl-beta-curcumene cyclase